jgi:general secretion pathway protein C
MFSHALAGMAGYYVMADAQDREDAPADDEDDEDVEDDEDAKAGAKKTVTPKTKTAASGMPKGFEYNAFCPTCLPPTVDLDDPEAVAAATAAASGAYAGEVETTLPLTLVATMEASAPGISVATIRIGEETEGATGLFSPGDEVLADVELLEVEAGLVHLRSSGRLEFLAVRKPGEVAKKSTTKAKLPDKPATTKKSKNEIDGASDAIKCNGLSCTVEKAFVEKLIAQPSLLLAQGSALPYDKDGLAGMRVSRVRTGTLPKLLGLKSGDIITSINGQSLATMDNAMGLYAKLRTAKHLSVEFTRNTAGVRNANTLEVDII